MSSQHPPIDGELFLEGGGEMGALMRARDWTGTALGPLSEWPQSLRTAVSVMLTAPQPCYVFWGPQLAMLYNDRGLPFVGLKHPDCLGQPTKIVLKEAWSVLGPLVDGVMTTGTPVYLENLLIPLERVGFLQDGYFTFSYIPARNETAAIGGILVVVVETTNQVVAARRLDLIGELSVRTATSESVADVLSAVEAVLSEKAVDIPFAQVYELRGEMARLVVNAGVPRDHDAAGSEIRQSDAQTWPVFRVAQSATEDLVDHAPLWTVPLPGGPSGEPAKRSLVLPLSAEQEGGVSHVLVAGLNPRYLFDDDARSFLQLLGRQIVASVAGARAMEEKTLRAARLAELDRQKTEFFSNVSHEFRTPLTLLLGPVENALEQQRPLSEDSLALVHRNALRLLKLVNNLLDFSRAEAGRARAAFRPADLSLLTRDLASGFRSAIERAGVTFDISTAESDIRTPVDIEMWEKIVLNLLSNAFKFTFEGRIAIDLGYTDTDAVLSVSDTGVGIDESEIPRLFERFHRVAGVRSRTHEGSGIGLALVADLVRLHGGRVSVSSRPGEGSTFTVVVPLHRERDGYVDDAVPDLHSDDRTASQVRGYLEEAKRWLPDTGTIGPIPSPARQSATPLRGLVRVPRLLVAEDNADMRDYLARLLGERWQVETVSDGSAALERALAHPPDVIVSDMMMPGLDGLALVQALRADHRTRDVPFILLSARADQQSTEEALACGASDYMVKPFSSRELVARVSLQLDIAAAQRAALQRLESFLIEAPAAIAVLRGPSLIFTLANDRYQELVGRRDLVGKAGREAVPELVEQGTWDALDQVYQTGEPIIANGYRAALSRRTGKPADEAYFNWVAQATRARDGTVDGVMIFAVEVTEQIHARRKIEEAAALEQTLRADAEAANRAKDEFLAMLGHELRNPLAPISTALQLMQMQGGDEGGRARMIIERQVGHLEDLVNDLLDVSRIAQGKIELKRTRVEIASVVAQAIEMASVLLEQRRHRLEILVAPTGLLVDGDAGRLKQVFSNLISNAAKYTEQGGHIVIDATSDGEQITVDVRDNGVGLSKEMLPRVFDLFSQVPQSLARSQGGLGLGLAIVRSIVTMHGGTVHVTSEGEGLGSTFTVILPTAGAAGQATDGAKHAEKSASGPARRLHRILIVDDNVDAAELLAATLSHDGHTTRMALDGPSALRVAAELRPTVALLDIGLPVMDGYELARLLRIEFGPSLRLIAITGYGQQEDRQRSEAAGFNAHLVKPMQLHELHKLLDTADQMNRPLGM